MIGEAYSNTAGGGQAVSASGGAPSLTPFETDKTSDVWNIGIGLYGQPIIRSGKKVLTFDFHLGYGESYFLDEARMIGQKETSLKKYVGLNAYIPFFTF